MNNYKILREKKWKGFQKWFHPIMPYLHRAPPKFVQRAGDGSCIFFAVVTSP